MYNLRLAAITVHAFIRELLARTIWYLASVMPICDKIKVDHITFYFVSTGAVTDWLTLQKKAAIEAVAVLNQSNDDRYRRIVYSGIAVVIFVDNAPFTARIYGRTIFLRYSKNTTGHAKLLASFLVYYGAAYLWITSRDRGDETQFQAACRMQKAFISTLEGAEELLTWARL
jgi:hypothetical protein